MKRRLATALLLPALALSGCPANVPDVSCVFTLPTADRVSSTGGFNLLVNVTGTFTAEELPAVRFFSDLEANSGVYPDGLLLESGINTEGDCALDGCPAGGRLETPITPGTHTITAMALTPTADIACEATVVVDANAAPGITSITIAPAAPRTTDALSFTFESADDEGDAVQVNASWSGPDGQTVAGETVAGFNTEAGDVWTVTLTPRDSFDVGEPSTASVTIVNTPPSAPTVAISPVPARENSAIVCAVTNLVGLDPDTAQTLDVGWSWTVDGADAGISGPSVAADAQEAGEEWTCTAVVNDGEADSDPTSASTTVVDVLAVPATAMIEDLPIIEGVGLQRLGDSAKIGAPGDLDDDGFGDFVLLESSSVTVITSGSNAGQGTGNGHAYVYSGATVTGSGPWATTDASSDLVGPDGLKLTTVYGPGDINGDGADDLVIGFKHVSLPNTNTGTGIFLVYGEPGGLPATIDLETDAVVVYGGSGGEVGQVPCPVGDLDGDGFAELAIAAPRADGITGAVYVAYGLPASFASGLNPDDLLPGFRIDGSAAGHQLGTSCAGIMDLDGDGYDDIAVGAPGAGTAGNGRVVVYKGEEGRWSGSQTSATADVIIDASPTSTGGFGIAMQALGDHDGDGSDDFAIWATGSDGGQAGRGAVFIASGGAPSFSGAVTSADLPYTISGGADLGFCQVLASGDVNGDGLGDLLCGDQNSEAASQLSAHAAARLFLGSTSVPASRTWSNPDHALLAGDDGDRPGAAMAVVGDLDGNDYNEVLVGTPDRDLTEAGNGEATFAPGAVFLLDLSAD